MDQDKAKTYFWALLDILIAALVLGFLFVGLPFVYKFGGALPRTQTMTVSAEGKATVTPDLAQSSLSVTSRGKDPQELADANNKKISAVVDFLKSEGLAEKDIKTTGYYLSPDYQYDPKTQRSFITGYTLTQTVSVKMRDFAKVPEIIGGLTPLGINQISGINFSVEDPEKFLSEARAEAFARAETKAKEMAGSAGVGLGRVLNVAESQGSIPIPYDGAARSMEAAAPMQVAAPTIEPGSEEVNDSITITYELR